MIPRTLMLWVAGIKVMIDLTITVALLISSSGPTASKGMMILFAGFALADVGAMVLL